MSGIRSTITTLATALLIAIGSPAYAYRPFISTDAAVADPHQVEIEMGVLNWAQNGNPSAGSNTNAGARNFFTVPQTVLNYGVVDRVELVGQFNVDEIGGNTQFADPALNVKVVAKEGFLQNKPGDSFAFETSLLIPSPLTGEERFGFQETGIWSHPIGGFIFHVNVGPGIAQDSTEGFLFLGTIAEHPITKTLRAVGEISVQDTVSETPDNSGLVGLIWDTPKPDLALDVGLRRGLSSDAPDWLVSMGFSYGFIP
jgi:hypothetical protein